MEEEKKNIRIVKDNSAKEAVKEAVKEEPKKLTYEQLEAYAAQTTQQAQRVFQENQMLRKALYEQSLKEVELALKCLDHAEKFSDKFIVAITEKIEEIMTPNQGDNKAKEEVKEN